MKLWGVAMVRNESDVIEAFVRHNLTVLDGLIVVDHGSSDATMPILTALCQERLPLIVKRADAPGYLQSEIMTIAAREAFATARADAVFTLDADEFLRVRSRQDLEAALAALPAMHVGRVAWPTYLADPAAGEADILAVLRSARRWRGRKLPHSPSMTRKVVLTSAFAREPSANLTMGNHGVILGNDLGSSPPMPGIDLDRAVATVCHVPVRSASQYVVKNTVKRLARVAAGRDYPAGSAILGMFDAIRRDEALSPLMMLAPHVIIDEASHSSFFSAPRAPDDAFLADFVLRYTPPKPPDPLPIVLAAVEGLVRRATDARRARANR